MSKVSTKTLSPKLTVVSNDMKSVTISPEGNRFKNSYAYDGESHHFVKQFFPTKELATVHAVAFCKTKH